ncbi:transglutaminaseTgpA domain-containing protein [Homoserinibacter sp. YIM 151385]|uniref:transglutaminaseTgpA domain-containing protein n=1 Tax=Homoserinibacter sp. YIM 151385 TaxID=2985506 RepID=UPI0022F1185F|nr:transglutaminaseTgpA domain-containing protein [Homoserinibacter sp. YIM 151385]WBU38311.1 transglutaminaseTgpA domain-containing protein [Homoserinibacter sp. YIM 151385]
MNPQRGVASALSSVLFTCLSVGIAALTMWPVYQGERFLVLIGIGLVLGTLVAAAGAAWRWPAAVVVLAGFLVFLAAGVPVAVPERAVSGVLPSLDGILELLGAVALSWRQLLTITLPVGSYQALLVPAFLLVLGGAIVALSVALRSRRPELAAIPSVVILVVGIVFGPATVPWPVPLALALLAVILLWCVRLRSMRRRAAIRLLAPEVQERPRRLEAVADRIAGVRSVVAAGLILALAAGAGIGATTGLPPAGERDVLRTAVEQPFDPRAYPSPLAGLRRYLAVERRDEVMLHVDGLPDGARLRVAALDSYDGVVYSVGSSQEETASGSFVRVPTSVDQSGVDGVEVVLEVEILGYRGVWVPLAGAFEEIGFRGGDAQRLADSFYFNDTGDTAAVIRGLDAGDAYRVRSVVAAPLSDEEVGAARPGGARVPRLGELPDGLALKLDAYVDDAQEPGERLLAAIQGLREEGYISHGIDEEEPQSRSGHAADRITELVTDDLMIGDAEQYAATAALMARQLGFPARVVVGFAPAASGSPIDVLGSDATAWIEVDVAGRGWVAIDPVPPPRPIPEEDDPEPEQVARPQSPVQPPPEDPDPRDEQTPPDTSQQEQQPDDRLLQIVLAVLRVAGIAAGALLVLLSPFLLIVGAKARRRRLRRRAPTPVQRISGGWEEFRDALLDRGYEPPASATRSETARVSQLEQSRTLAAVADRAVFGPGEPDAEDADRVWTAVGGMRADLDRGRSRRQRLVALISLRSLGGYSGRSLFTR